MSTFLARDRQDGSGHAGLCEIRSMTNALLFGVVSDSLVIHGLLLNKSNDV